MAEREPQGQASYLDALEHLQGSGYEFAGVLSNHGPMASDALVELGAADLVVRWADTYRTRLTTEPELAQPITGDEQSWRPALGDIGRVADWTQLFRRELTQARWDDVLVRWWPRLLPGLAAAATHGVIRTAHAVRAIGRGNYEPGGSPDHLLIDELAHGLGYWAARYRTLPGPMPGLDGSRAAADLMDEIAGLTLTAQPQEPGIVGSMVLAGTMPGFHAALTGLAGPDRQTRIPDALGEITRAAAHAFVAHPGPGIPMVHALTGPGAVHLVLPHLPAGLHAPSLAMSWKVSASIVGAFAGDRVPVPDTVLDADELVGRVLEHGDEHVIKMCEACLREHARRPNEIYLQAAEKAISLIEPLS